MIRGITWTHIQSVRNQSDPSDVPYSIPQTSNWSGTFSFAVSYSKPTGSRVPSVKSYLTQSINLYFELEKNALLFGGSGHQSCNDGYMLLSVIKGKPSKAKDTFFLKKNSSHSFYIFCTISEIDG